MCFSAAASFGAGAVLSVIGVASVKQVKSPPHFLFASIPIFFAIQQITEGFLWLSLTNPLFASIQQNTTYTFLFFAQVVWPIWVPLSILKLEPKGKKNLVEKLFVGLGAIVSIYLAYCLFNFPVEGKILGHHIVYEQGYPAELSLICGISYILVTIFPPFFSRIKSTWILGTAILISYIITTIFYTDYLVSVWCYFAAIISIAVFVILYRLKKTPNKVDEYS